MDHTREGLLRYFSGRPTLPAWVGRGLLGAPDPGDRSLRQQLVRARAALAGVDGSVGGSLTATAAAVVDLVELGAPSGERDRMVAWLLARQGRPGAFHEGCTAARHQHRVCEHFLGGFFSPAAPTRRVAPLTLPNGRIYRVESQARFAASCLALDAVVRAGGRHEAGVERHLDSFAALREEWARWGEHLAPDLAFSAIAALGGAGDRWRPLLVSLVDVVGGRQGEDGTWPQADFFNALDGLTRVPAEVAARLLRRARPTLRLRQREDGSFGSAAADERALIALRTLLAAEG